MRSTWPVQKAGFEADIQKLGCDIREPLLGRIEITSRLACVSCVSVSCLVLGYYSLAVFPSFSVFHIGVARSELASLVV